MYRDPLAGPIGGCVCLYECCDMHACLCVWVYVFTRITVIARESLSEKCVLGTYALHARTYALM